MPSIAMVMMMLVASLLGAVPAVEGRECGTVDVFKFLEGKAKDCTTLWIGYDTAVNTTALAEALKSNTALTTLTLWENNIGDSGAAAIAEALKSNTALTELYLYTNNIGDSGAAAIADTLKVNTALTSLTLYGNNIGDSGAAAVAEALKNNTALATLELHGNNIGDSGAAAIAEALKSNTALTELSLGYNKIGDRGAAAIAEALKSNTALTSLSLYSNNIGDSGAAALAEALKSNTALTEDGWSSIEAVQFNANSNSNSCASGPCDCSSFPIVSGMPGYCDDYTSGRDYRCDACCLQADCMTPRRSVGGFTTTTTIFIAGVVIGSLIVVACLGYACYRCRKNHLKASKTMAQQPDLATDPWPGQGRGAFSDGLFDCTSDLGSACKTWYCPCLSVIHITNVAPELGNFNEWLTCCGLCSLLGGGFLGPIGCMIAELAYRERARQLYGIPEGSGECPDLCAVCCCQCCALSQLHRHVDRYPTQNLQEVVVASPYRTAAYAGTPAEDRSYALTNDEYLSVAAGHGGGNKAINIDVGHADSSAGKAKESFSGFDNGTSDDEI